MDYLAALLGKKTPAEQQLANTATLGVAIDVNPEPPKVPAALGMMAKMLGITPEDMMASMTMVAGVAGDLAAIKDQQENTTHILSAMMKSMAEMRQEIRETKEIVNTLNMRIGVLLSQIGRGVLPVPQMDVNGHVIVSKIDPNISDDNTEASDHE